MAIKLIAYTFIGALFIFLIWGSSQNSERFELQGLLNTQPFELVLYDKETGDFHHLVFSKTNTDTKKLDTLHQQVPEETKPIHEWLKQDYSEAPAHIREEQGQAYYYPTQQVASSQFVQYGL